MAFKKIIFEDKEAHLSQLTTKRGTANKSVGDLESGKIFGLTEEGLSGDMDKIAVQNPTTKEIVYIAQSDINSSEATITFDESSLLGGTWNGTGTGATVKLATASIAGNGLEASTTVGEILVKVKGDNGALNNIDLSSSGIKVSSSIVDSSNPKGLQFTTVLETLRGNNISLVNGGELSVNTSFNGFENDLVSGSNAGISISSDLRSDTAFGYDGTDSGNVAVISADIDTPTRGIIADGTKLSVHTSSLSNDQLFQWGGSTGQLSGSAISEGTNTISIAKNVDISGHTSVAGTFQVDGSSTNLVAKDPIIMLHSGGGSNDDFGFNGDQGGLSEKFGWSYDASEGRWGFTNGTGDAINTVMGYGIVVKTGIAPSAADASIKKNGNMIVNNEECFIYAS